MLNLPQINPSKIKMPSTPVDSPYDEISDCINSPDRAQAPSLFLRHQQIKNVYATADCLEQQKTLHKPLKMLNVIGTPDSDHHSSDHDSSPKIQRRRKNLIAIHAEEKLNLPKLSISMDHHDSNSPKPSHSHHMLSSPSTSGQFHNISSSEKRVMKSASAVDLSLKISSPLIVDNLRKDRTKLKLETNLFKPIENESNLECDSMSSRPPNNNGGSSASSREVSPSRDGPTITNLKPP